MKKKLSYIAILICCFYLLTHPVRSFEGAAAGLLLWFNTLLPTLLPFLILSNILLKSHLAENLSQTIYPLIRHFVPVTAYGIFPLIAGFLFGFPVGSKITADLYNQNLLNRDDAETLAMVSNNLSPMFLISFISAVKLNRPDLAPLTVCFVYLPPLLYLYLHAAFKHTRTPETTITLKKASRFQMNFKIIDASILDSFETITKIGGYIMLFAIVVAEIQSFALPSKLSCILIGITEVTNGISTLTASDAFSFGETYLLTIVFAAFGGLSGLAQTASMLKSTSLSLWQYLIHKIGFTLVSGLFCFLYLTFLY